MSRYTPGPWTYDEDASEILSGSEASGWIWIADVANSVPTGETQTNARLIAAAPDLLDALKDVVAGLEQFIHDPDTAPRVLHARAAIAKAEGR